MAMLLEWSFDEASGDVLDSSGNGRSFTITNSARTAAGSGYTMGGAAPNSKGLSATGTNIQPGCAITGLNTTSRTIMAWVKTSASDPSWFLEYHRAGTDDTGVWGFLNLSGTFRFRAKNSAGTTFERTLTLDGANFHHLAATHDGTTLKVYRDGVQVGADISMAFAVWGADDFRVFDGSQSAILDHVRVFDTALTSAEINTWMNTTTPTPSGATDLVIQDATVGVSSDNAVLTRIIDLAIQKATIALSADNISLAQIHNIAIHDAFVQTAADVVNFASQGGKVSIADLQAQKLPALTGQNGSVPDLLKFYYGGLSGLVPATAYTVTDHQAAYYRAQTGLGQQTTMADLERSFYDVKLVPSGSLSDREFVYWTGL